MINPSTACMNVTCFIKRYVNYMFLIFIFCSCKKNIDNIALPEMQPGTPVTVMFKNTLPSVLHESSGLCYTDGNLWTFGDSGNLNAIYKIDTATGAVVQIVIIQNFSNTDWEDIAADSSYIYIGDFGNNDGNRKDLKIIRIKKTDLNDPFPHRKIERFFIT
ncbi:MAG: hypothetical protein M3Z92_00115 [Bacteroidota bacterium]|nr:hypothetical protein [Bacteroidota bacterium]